MTAAPARPLVVRLRNWIGDVVLGLPALELLQAHGHALQLVARGAWAPALLAAYGWQVHVQPPELAAKVRQLRALPGRQALLLPASLSSAVEMRLAGKRAAGVAAEGRGPLLARRLPLPAAGHELDRHWMLACDFIGVHLPPPSSIDLRIPSAATDAAHARLAARGIGGRYIVACPFAGGRAATPGRHDKRWPGFSAFIALARRVLELPVVICPGPGEAGFARQLYPDAVSLPDCDLATFAALARDAIVVVANDTGPGHIAAAIGGRLVSVIGATEASRWAPVGPHVTIVRHPNDATDRVVWPTAAEVLALARRYCGG